MTPQSKSKRSRSSNGHETGQCRKRHSLASVTTLASQGKKTIPARSRQVPTQASERRSLQPFALKGKDEFLQRPMAPAPIKSEPFHLQSTAVPKGIVSAPMLSESVMTMTASEWRLAEPVSRWTEPSGNIPGGPNSLLNPMKSVHTSTESLKVSTESMLTSTETTPKSAPVHPKLASGYEKSLSMTTHLVPMSTESAAVSRKRRLMSGFSPLRGKSVSPTKCRMRTESESASSILASMWTDSDLSETSLETSSTAATKAEPDPMSIGSVPTSAKPSPKLTESAPVLTKSLPRTLGLAPELMESVENAIKSSSVQGVELHKSNSAVVKSVDSMVGCFSPAGGSEDTDCARDDIHKRAAYAAWCLASTSMVPEESRSIDDDPTRQVFTRRLPPGPGRGATLLDPSFEISWGASGSLLRGVTMEFARYPYYLENGRRSVSSDSEEEEGLSTDSSDDDVDRVDGYLGLVRRSVSRGGYQSKVFDWDRRFARKGGMIEDLSGGMEKNASIQVGVAA